MIGKIKRRVETGALVTAVVIPLALCVAAFLGLAVYFAFRESLPPHLAALVTASCGIVLITLILLVARIANRIRGSSASREDGLDGFELGSELETLLHKQADPVLSDWVRRNPDRAAFATLALGIAAGYSSQFRRVLLDLYSRYAETEALRRSKRD